MENTIIHRVQADQNAQIFELITVDRNWNYEILIENVLLKLESNYESLARYNKFKSFHR